MQPNVGKVHHKLQQPQKKSTTQKACTYPQHGLGFTSGADLKIFVRGNKK